MNQAAVNISPQALRVAVIAADSERSETLTRLVRALGHEVADLNAGPQVVFSDGSRANTSAPVLVLGSDVEGDGRLPPDASLDQIDAALRALSVGLIVGVREETTRRFEALESDERVLLTPRELDVLSVVAQGLTNKEIALQLDISRHTVKFHLESLMRKLGVSSRAEAVSKSLALRLLEPYRL